MRGFLAKVGFPAELAWPVFLAELIGGVLILTGVYARHVALLLIPVMAAASTVHIGNGWIFSNAGGGWEYPAFLIAASFALWLTRRWRLRAALAPAVVRRPARAPRSPDQRTV